MALTIGGNSAALQAASTISMVNRDIETSMTRLSTGKRINAASDDAAGVAIASRINAEILGTNQSIRNALDGQALIDTAEGAHKEVENILQRVREISVQASNDTNNAQDRSNLQSEMESMLTELDRIASVTSWGGQNLMKTDGTAFVFQVGAATGDKNRITVNIDSMATDSGGLNLTGTAKAVAVETAANGSFDTTSKVYTVAASASSASTYENAALNAAVTASTSITSTVFSNASGGVTAVATEMTGLINKHAEYIKAGISAKDNGDGTFTVNHGTTRGHLLSSDAATTTMDFVDTAIEAVNSQRSSLGAVSNRLTHTINNLTNISTNLSSSKSNIEDADFAVETTKLAKNQILQQSAMAMLAMANASKQNVLSLLQN